MRLPYYPHLPQSAVSAVIIGESYCDVLSPALKARGIDVIAMPKNSAVDKRLSCHADLSVLQAFDRKLIVSRQVATATFMSALSSLDAEIEFSDEPNGENYPQDAALCAAIVGKWAFHNRNFSYLSDIAELCHVNQGYAKCSVCPVTESAAITSDSALAAAMRRQGLEALQIAPGSIALEGFDTGFIGGCSFKLAPDILAFTGSLDAHPDRARILDFLKKHGVEPVFLTEKPIIDIGSAIIFE